MNRLWTIWREWPNHQRSISIREHVPMVRSCLFHRELVWCSDHHTEARYKRSPLHSSSENVGESLIGNIMIELNIHFLFVHHSIETFVRVEQQTNVGSDWRYIIIFIFFSMLVEVHDIRIYWKTLWSACRMESSGKILISFISSIISCELSVSMIILH